MYGGIEGWNKDHSGTRKRRGSGKFGTHPLDRIVKAAVAVKQTALAGWYVCDTLGS